MQLQHHPVGERNMRVILVNGIEDIAIPGNFRFGTIRRLHFVLHDVAHPLVVGDDPLDPVLLVWLRPTEEFLAAIVGSYYMAG